MERGGAHVAACARIPCECFALPDIHYAYPYALLKHDAVVVHCFSDIAPSLHPLVYNIYYSMQYSILYVYAAPQQAQT